MGGFFSVPSLKLTSKAPENGWLEDDPASFPFGSRPIFRGELLVLGFCEGRELILPAVEVQDEGVAWEDFDMAWYLKHL